MKQIVHFKLPAQQDEANAFLAKHAPEMVSANGDNLIINYDDGMTNDFYKATEMITEMTRLKSDIITERYHAKVAKHFLEKYVKELEDMNNTVITEANGKQKYDLSKDKEAKMEAYKKQIEGLTAQLLSFETKIEQSEVKIAVWQGEYDKLNLA